MQFSTVPEGNALPSIAGGCRPNPWPRAPFHIYGSAQHYVNQGQIWLFMRRVVRGERSGKMCDP
jgi:hypothetical protein